MDADDVELTTTHIGAEGGAITVSMQLPSAIEDALRAAKAFISDERAVRRGSTITLGLWTVLVVDEVRCSLTLTEATLAPFPHHEAELRRYELLFPLQLSSSNQSVAAPHDRELRP